MSTTVFGLLLALLLGSAADGSHSRLAAGRFHSHDAAPSDVQARAPLPEPPQRITEAALPPGPSLESCRRAATRKAALDPKRAQRWLTAARRSAWLPTVDTAWERRMGRGWRLDREVGSPDELADDGDRDDLWRVRLGWELDRLWFNPDELRAARAAADLARLRRELLIELTTLYFERARTWRAARTAAVPAERAEARLRAVELGGLLTAITGLDFPAPPAPDVPPKGPDLVQ